VIVASFLILIFGKISLDKRKKICRIGGIAIISGFLAALFADPNLFISEKLWGVIVASFLILIFGVSDDFFNFNWKTQLSFQIAISVLVFIFGLRIEYVSNPIGGMIFLNLGKYLIPSLIFTIFWIVLSINSMNWVDGVDGLSGGVALIGVVTIFFLSLKPEVNQPPIAIITMALAGAFLGFLVFNFYPSKILAGTSGSMFMGFILSILAIFAGTKIATALLILAIPIIDAIWVIWERIISGNSIFKRDNRHLHHKLMDLGWSQQKIALSFYAVTICIAFVALNTRAMGKLITMVSVFSVMTIFLIVINKKLKKTYFA
jgi:UDP-GlcNAc:undecaprenyl-phosphate GlcNAc-1-phosphate transferase